MKRSIDLRAEMLFWLRQLMDHMQFIWEALHPGHTDVIGQARQLQHTMERLLKRLEESDGQPEAALVDEAVRETERMIAFKQRVLQGLLTCRLGIMLPPSAIEHMILEAQEFRVRVEQARSGAVPSPTADALHQHMLWLRDASGHAALVRSMVDPVEGEVAQRSYMFEQSFDALLKKADALALMLRDWNDMLPALTWLNYNAEQHMGAFDQFLGELQQRVKDCRLLGFLTPRLIEHFRREADYYLDRLRELRPRPAGPYYA